MTEQELLEGFFKAMTNPLKKHRLLAGIHWLTMNIKLKQRIEKELKNEPVSGDAEVIQARFGR